MQWKEGEKFLDGGKQSMCEMSELVFCFTMRGEQLMRSVHQLHNTIPLGGQLHSFEAEAVEVAVSR